MHANSLIMESLNDVNQKILLTTLKIQESFPELTKYLDEMPEHFEFTKQKGVNRKDLEDYLDSLSRLLDTFSKYH